MRGAVRMSHGAAAVAGVLAAAVVLSLAATPVFAQTPLTGRQEEGRKLFQSTCFYCHSERVWGTFAIERRRGPADALLEKRTDLVPDFVKSVVRNGLGSMPAYRRTELTDAEVDAIIAYLTRANPAK